MLMNVAKQCYLLIKLPLFDKRLIQYFPEKHNTQNYEIGTVIAQKYLQINSGRLVHLTSPPAN